MLPALESTGLKVGEDFFLAFCPERVDPGNPKYRHPQHAQGGRRHHRRLHARWRGALRSRPSTPSCRCRTTEAAELVKLLENTFRSVNIGLVNEMAIVCDKLGVDVWEVIEAAATKPFGFMKFLPGPGSAGTASRSTRTTSRGRCAASTTRRASSTSPARSTARCRSFWVRKLAEALNDAGQAVQGGEGAGARRRLQEGHRGHAREPGARHHRGCSSDTARTSPTTIHTSQSSPRTGHDARSVPLTERPCAPPTRC